jgi:hypothetical protein
MMDTCKYRLQCFLAWAPRVEPTCPRRDAKMLFDVDSAGSGTSLSLDFDANQVRTLPGHLFSSRVSQVEIHLVILSPNVFQKKYILTSVF